MEKVTENMFGGEDSEAQNVLMQTFKECAKDDDLDIYGWLDKTPKTSMVVELVDKLGEFGYTITKKSEWEKASIKEVLDYAESILDTYTDANSIDKDNFREDITKKFNL